MDCTMYKYFAALWLSKRRAQPASSPPSIVYSTRDVSALTFWTCKRIFQSLQVSQLLYIVICATTYSKVLLEKYAAFTVIKIYIPTCTQYDKLAQISPNIKLMNCSSTYLVFLSNFFISGIVCTSILLSKHKQVIKPYRVFLHSIFFLVKRSDDISKCLFWNYFGTKLVFRWYKHI
jgi:hypothetical protein